MEVRYLGRRDYPETETAMRVFTAERSADTADELWLCEHLPVYTLGVAGREAHLHEAGGIAVVRTDRGGQITYHGPGQVVAYPLVNMRRVGIYVKEFVYRLEQAVLRTLADFGVTGHRVRTAPGIYVRRADPFGHDLLQLDAADPFAGLAKIAALGIKISRGCSYHGLALNVAMDLAPFNRIDPCGYAGLQTVDLRSLGVAVEMAEAASSLARHLQGQLSA